MSTYEIPVAAPLPASDTITVLRPGDPGYDRARLAFNVAVDQRPAAIVEARSEADVVAAVRFARATGLRVAPQATGHNPAPLGDLSGSLLLKTTALKGVVIDAEARTVRVRAGAVWEDVTGPASDLGLAALHGSSPDVGVVGYCLGGGMGWYARRHGLACNHVIAVELVTADGEQLRVTAESDPDLFWALRGGGGNFGVVTALELRLLPLTEVYAGALFFDAARAAEVLRAWHALLPGLPDEMTSVGRLLQVPPLPEVPEPLRGRSFVVVEAAYLGTRADGEALLAPVRALGAEIDTFAMVPPAALAELHMDPRSPVPVASGHALLADLGPTALEALVATVGPGSGSALVSVELRHTGGALARPADGHGALATLAGDLCLFAVGVTPGPEAAAAVEADLARLAAVVAPFVAGRYLNFAEQSCDPRAAFGGEDLARLRAVRARHDALELLCPNHPVG